ncbi:MAG: ion transporter [Fibrobacterales bacterium]
MRNKLHEIIYEADTPAGKIFDEILLWSIIVSVLAVVLESVESVSTNYYELLKAVEWFFTILFSIEYILRLVAVRNPFSYVFSFYGIVDFLAIVPTYLSFIIAGPQYFMAIRILRLLRVYRIFKLVRYTNEARNLMAALRNARRKMTVFVSAVCLVVIVIGSIMYVVEQDTPGFESIPSSIYWAVVTMTTVGYGDVVPYTLLGKFFTSLMMIVGYGMIAVPTGIMSVELSRVVTNTQACPRCGVEDHSDDAKFCRKCGATI